MAPSSGHIPAGADLRRRRCRSPEEPCIGSHVLLTMRERGEAVVAFDGALATRVLRDHDVHGGVHIPA
jgi:hypothetical protein